MLRNVIILVSMAFVVIYYLVFIAANFKSNERFAWLNYDNMENISENGTVRILFWTKIFKGLIIDEIQGQSPVPSWCQFTFDRSQILRSHAVIFHVPWREVKSTDLPKARRWDQIWVFFSLESPAYMYFEMSEWDAFKFNRTLTYRLDSNFSSPYGVLVPREKPLESWTIPGNKTKLAVWMVSNCDAPSKRTELAKQLQKYLKVDIYGKCGTFACNDTRLQCYHKFGQKYKFYFSFENSLCTDYVTEKFFNALKYGMVPVGFSGANYSNFVPDGSFIDARSFSSAKELANFLNFLDKNQTAYAKYFEWNKYYEIKVRQRYQGFRKMCFALRDTNELNRTFTYENMKKWWRGDHCSKKGLP